MLMESLLKGTLLNPLPTSFSQLFWSIFERDARINELELGRKRVIPSDSRSFLLFFVLCCSSAAELIDQHFQKTDLCADLMVHVYLSDFIKKYLQKFQERFRNLSLEENKMRRNDVTYWTTAVTLPIVRLVPL